MGVGMPYKTTCICMFMSIFVCGGIYSKHIFLSYQNHTHSFFIDGHTLLQDVQDEAHQAFCIPSVQDVRIVAAFKELQPGLVLPQLTQKESTLFVDTFPEITTCQYTQEYKENIVIVYDVKNNEYQNISLVENINLDSFLKQIAQELQRPIVHVTVDHQKLSEKLLQDTIAQRRIVWVY